MKAKILRQSKGIDSMAMAKEKALPFVVRFKANELSLSQGGLVTINGADYRVSMILSIRPCGKKIVEVTLLARALKGEME
ncbi:hypothetical protein [Sporosarcina sp. SAFN-010]|uniref:hypothetical protein n=1 Tax=Sporosarcina sp. SAFN-010 TaxID=3387273 RepID=UPI003F7CE202